MSDETNIPPGLGKAVTQLRSLVCGLGAIVLVVSVCFSGFVWKLARDAAAVAVARQEQLSQLQTNVTRLSAVANDLASYSAGRPELLAIFRSHNINLKAPAPAPAAAPVATPSSAPAPTSETFPPPSPAVFPPPSP